jgi:hypothetical protein
MKVRLDKFIASPHFSKTLLEAGEHLMRKIENSIVKNPVGTQPRKASVKAKKSGASSPDFNKKVDITAKSLAALTGTAAISGVAYVGYHIVRDLPSSLAPKLMTGAGLLIGSVVVGATAGNFAYEVLNHAPGATYKILGMEIDLDQANAKIGAFLKDPRNVMITTAGAVGLGALAISVAPVTAAVTGVALLAGYELSALEAKKNTAPVAP